jgi:hypothetical protein
MKAINIVQSSHPMLLSGMLQRAKNRTATSTNAMTIKAVPIRRVRGPVSLTGARQAFFCHACEATLSVSERL